MNVYEYDDYVAVLKAFFKKQFGQTGVKTQFAEAAGCKLSYLSQVLAEDVHLTLDHAFGAARFMALDDHETQYFLLLVQHARAATHTHKSYLRSQMQSIRAREHKLNKKLRSENKISSEALQTYYGNWLYQAIHMYLTIPKYQKFASLRDQLGIPTTQLRTILQELTKMGLVETEKEAWKPILRDMHLPLDSPLTIQRHLQWKMRAITDMQLKEPDSLHYEATFSLSNSDVEKLKSMLFEFIDRSRSIALKSPEEEVAHIDISLFRV